MSKSTLFQLVVLVGCLIFYLYSLSVMEGSISEYDFAIVNISFFLMLGSGAILGQKAGTEKAGAKKWT